jgi:glutaminase
LAPDPGTPPYVSTGHLPAAADVQAAVDEAHQTYRGVTSGAVSDVYPTLSRVPPASFGICLADVAGNRYAAGDASRPFVIMSVAKPFVFALVCAALGPEQARKNIGVNATGLPFSSLEAVERGRDGVTNPMVNPGAIAATSLLPGGTAEARWRSLIQGLSAFAGRELTLDEEAYACAARTNHRNRAIVSLLGSCGRVYCDPAVALDLYTRQSCLAVTAQDLAVMGATLADGGLNPLTGEQVTSANACRCALAVMATAGLYETSGDWLYEVGAPGKSGIGGGIITVSPGKGGLGTFAPPLDRAGNSVRGQLAAHFLSRRLGLGLFGSHPADRAVVPAPRG